MNFSGLFYFKKKTTKTTVDIQYWDWLDERFSNEKKQITIIMYMGSCNYKVKAPIKNNKNKTKQKQKQK